jgi:hypothetical protein
LIRHRISAKDQKRQEPGWDRADNSILLLRTFQDVRKIRDYLKETNHADFVPLNGFKEIWLQDAVYSFWKDGEFLGSAVVCIHPANRWLAQRILRLHRRVGLTNKDVYTPLEGPSKGGPLIAFTLGEPPRNE